MSWPGPFQRAEVENPCNWKNKNPTNNWGWPDKLLTVSLFPLKLPPSPQTSRDKWNSRPNEACLHLPALKPVYTLYASRLWQLKRKAKTEWCTIFHKGHIPIVPWLHGRDSRMQHDDQLTRTFRNTVVNMNLLADEHCDLLCMRKHMLSTTILLGWELASSIEQQKISWESALFERFNMCYLWFFNVLPSSSKNVQTWKIFMLVIDMPMIIQWFPMSFWPQVHQWILLWISQKVATSGAQQNHKTGLRHVFPNELPAIQLDLLRIWWWRS